MDRIKKILKKIDDSAEVAIVLGSGFGDAKPNLENIKEYAYEKLGIKYNVVSGHSRKLVFGDYKGKRILLFSRLHFYETGSMENIKLLYKVLSELGVKYVLMSTAVGGVNASYLPTDLVLIKDHINLTGQNPLIAETPIKFIDLKDVYDEELRNIAKIVAAKNNIILQEGVHCQLAGPTYETPAEVKMLRTMGVDTVSMSPVLDIIMAYSLGMKIMLVAGVSNRASDLIDEEITHEEVLKNGKVISKKMKVLFEGVLSHLIKNV